MEIKLSDVISKQAMYNVGLTGHVSHGKSTLTRKLTGTVTTRHSCEHKTNNRTVKLGYANAKIYWHPSTQQLSLNTPNSPDSVLVRHFSFPDCPGHDEFISTMHRGATVMDASILVVAANEPLPQPQTTEHYHVLEMKGLTPDRVVIAHNKLDRATREAALRDYTEICRQFPSAGVVPISAEYEYNLDQILHSLTRLPKPATAIKSAEPFLMTIVRSFNINKPSTKLTELKGAVIGGTIQSGILTVGDYVELLPGVVYQPPGASKPIVRPLIAQVVAIFSEQTQLEYAVPGGLIGVELSLDSGLATADSLAGYCLTHPKSATTASIINRFASGATLPASLTLITSTGREVKATAKDGTVTISEPIVHIPGQPLTVLSSVSPTQQIHQIESPSLTLEIYRVESAPADWTPPVYHLVDDLPELPVPEPMSYEELLDKIHFSTGTEETGLRLPGLVFANTTRHHMEVANIAEVIRALDFHRDSDEHAVDISELLLNFIKQELTDSARYKQDNDNGSITALFLKKKPQADLNRILIKFAETYLACPSCHKSYRTIITKPPRDTLCYRKCLNCPSVTSFKLSKL